MATLSVKPAKGITSITHRLGLKSKLQRRTRTCPPGALLNSSILNATHYSPIALPHPTFSTHECKRTITMCKTKLLRRVSKHVQAHSHFRHRRMAVERKKRICFGPGTCETRFASGRVLPADWCFREWLCWVAGFTEGIDLVVWGILKLNSCFYAWKLIS